MKKFFTSVLFISLFVLVSCYPSPVRSQNLEGWFCTNLYMQGTGTHASAHSGYGIFGTDTTFTVTLSSPQYSTSWWSISCNSTAVTTGTVGYVSIKASNDGVNYFNIPHDTSATGASTPFYKWTVSSSGSVVFKNSNFPYRNVGLYILKGNTSQPQVNCFYHFERIYNGR